MSVSFTKGPWRVDPKANTYASPSIAIMQGDDILAEVLIDERLDTSDDPEAEANARLIAAAPKLYSELKAAAAIFRSYEALHLQKGTGEGDQKAAVNAAYAETFERTLAEIESDQ